MRHTGLNPIALPLGLIFRWFEDTTPRLPLGLLSWYLFLGSFRTHAQKGVFP